MAPNSILIGSGGQVGRQLSRLLREKKLPFVESNRNEAQDPLYLDLEEGDSVENFFSNYNKQRPDEAAWVFLVGAFTHVDGCEQNQQKCQQINALAPTLIARACEKYGYKLIFFSSEYVFGEAEYQGGAIGPFSEDAPVAPTSAYGRAKADAEAAIQNLAQNLNYLILRTTVVYSWGEQEMNFAMQLYRFLKAKIAGEPTQYPSFKIPVDQISSPTDASFLASASLELCDQDQKGIFHVTGADSLSRADFTKRLVDCFGFDWEACAPYLEFLKTEQISQTARRPLSAGLKTDKLKSKGIAVPNLQESLQAFAQSMRAASLE